MPSATTAQREHTTTDRWRRVEGAAGESLSEYDLERPLPSSCRRRVWTDPPRDGPLVEHEVGADQPTAGVQQPAQHRTRRRERRVGHDVERLSWQPQVGGVGVDDEDLTAELGTQGRRSLRMPFDGDDVGAEAHERARQGTVAGTDVEDEIATPNARRGDDLLSPVRVEPVPAPLTSRSARAATGGHGGPSRSSS
jgi:hypothetical protein